MVAVGFQPTVGVQTVNPRRGATHEPVASQSDRAGRFGSNLAGPAIMRSLRDAIPLTATVALRPGLNAVDRYAAEEPT